MYQRRWVPAAAAARPPRPPETHRAAQASPRIGQGSARSGSRRRGRALSGGRALLTLEQQQLTQSLFAARSLQLVIALFDRARRVALVERRQPHHELEPLLLQGSYIGRRGSSGRGPPSDRKSTRLNSSHVKISYAVFCLKKKNSKYGHVNGSIREGTTGKWRS